jgi:outer membrane protein assembly factor BamB
VIPAPRGKRRLPWLVLGAVVFVLGGGVVLVFGKGGDLFNPEVTFLDTTDRPAAIAPAPAGHHPADDNFDWPLFGYTKSRTHVLNVRQTPRPPWREAWSLRGNVLLEFSPVLCDRSLYLLKNNGMVDAISRTTGQVRWQRKVGRLAASSPACGGGAVYVVLLRRRHAANAGLVARLSASTGAIEWQRKLPSRAESSPLLDSGRLYFGTEDGTVYAMRASNGHVRWKAKANGAVKGALALDGGKLYFGDYGGKVHAIRRSDGGKVWQTDAASGGLGITDSNIYSTAAVRYGRVYIGSTNGDVYSFSSSDGKLAWRKRTGGYVYASPAVGQIGNDPPTVFIGSYDGNFYALDARSGRVRWQRRLGKKISGGATVVGDLVWVSDLQMRTTWALDTHDGTTVYKTGRGAFHPVISDGRRIYFAGYSSLFALDPAARPFDRRAAALKAMRDKIHQRIERRASLRHARFRRAQRARHARFLRRGRRGRR